MSGSYEKASQSLIQPNSGYNTRARLEKQVRSNKLSGTRKLEKGSQSH